MSKWIDVGSSEDYPEGAKKCVYKDGADLCVMNVEGELRAIENLCPHAGMPLGEGSLRGAILTCPFHGYTFNVVTGKNVDDPYDENLTQYPIRCENDRIEVDVEPE